MNVPGLYDFAAVAAGNIHSMALRNDGTVWTWGWNLNGQLGDSTTLSSFTPIQVYGLSNVLAISAGHLHSVALKNDSVAWSWGRNVHGQLGDSTQIVSLIPVEVLGLTEITNIAAGYDHSLFISRDSLIAGCGYNEFGQLGNEGLNNYYTSPQITEFSCNGTILPIELLSFEGINDGTINKLKWLTSSESNNKYFIIQHSINALDFIEIGRLNSSGNSHLQQEYQFIHEKPNIGINYYRLKKIDFDGQYDYSQAIAIMAKDSQKNEICSIFPNPASYHIMLDILPFDANAIFEIQIFNTLEQLISTEIKSSELSEIDISTLEAGIYYIVVTYKKCKQVKKLVITR